MRRVVFSFWLIGTTFILIYSFVENRVIKRNLRLYYFQGQFDEENRYCYEQLTVNQRTFSQEDILFTVLNNLITGPQGLFMESRFKQSLSIRKVYILDSILIVDFSQTISQLSLEEELLLLTVFINTLKSDFPNIEEMVWLSDGRQLPFIKGAHHYNFPLKIENFNLKQGSIPDLSSVTSC